jgi:hypothetical protein
LGRRLEPPEIGLTSHLELVGVVTIEERDMTIDHKLGRTTSPPLTTGQARQLIAAAVTAPSVFNSQPWKFRIHGRTVELYANPDREFRDSVDPQGRQLAISCGAALFNLRVAAAHIRRPATVHLLPDSRRPHLLATVDLDAHKVGPLPDEFLYSAIRRRHTYRRSFDHRAIPSAIVAELAEAARTEQAVFTVISDRERNWLFDLVAFSEVVLEQEDNYAETLKAWTAGDPSRDDGIPASAFGTLPWSGRPPMRDFAQGRPGHAMPRESYGSDPCIAVLATAADDPAAWLHAGQALQRVLLVACLRGLAASFLNQPLDVPEIRRDMEHRGFHGAPQMILRLGYASGAVSTPRRPISSVLGVPQPD